MNSSSSLAISQEYYRRMLPTGCDASELYCVLEARVSADILYIYSTVCVCVEDAPFLTETSNDIWKICETQPMLNMTVNSKRQI